MGSCGKADLDNITSDHDQKVEKLRRLMGPMSGRNLLYCSNACLRRYLVSRDWDVEKARKMLEATLKWRSEYKPEEIQWHDVAKEGETGKAYKASFQDREGRSVIIMRPRNQIRHLVYLTERAILHLPPEQEQMVWLIDFTGWSFRQCVPIKTAKDAVEILQNHYPERLCALFFYNPPWFFEPFWKIAKYFVDEKTFQKLKFVFPNNEESTELMRANFDLETLPMEFGGKLSERYDHEVFSRLMLNADIISAAFWGIGEEKQPLHAICS
ncbi:uncharacterized protein LOC144707915 isoform X2 [Wolffia australiana]